MSLDLFRRVLESMTPLRPRSNSWTMKDKQDRDSACVAKSFRPLGNTIFLSSPSLPSVVRNDKGQGIPDTEAKDFQTDKETNGTLLTVPCLTNIEKGRSSSMPDLLRSTSIQERRMLEMRWRHRFVKDKRPKSEGPDLLGDEIDRIEKHMLQMRKRHGKIRNKRPQSYLVEVEAKDAESIELAANCNNGPMET